jgi:hypothetical protein
VPAVAPPVPGSGSVAVPRAVPEVIGRPVGGGGWGAVARGRPVPYDDEEGGEDSEYDLEVALSEEDDTVSEEERAAGTDADDRPAGGEKAGGEEGGGGPSAPRGLAASGSVSCGMSAVGSLLGKFSAWK